MLGWWGDKSPGVSLLEIPPQRHQLELFLGYYTVNKLLYGARHTKFCYGKPGVEAVRKPGLFVWVGDVHESSRACQVTGAAPCEGAPAPAVTVSGAGTVTARVSQMVKLGSFLNTNVIQIPTLNAYSFLKNKAQVFICLHGVLPFCNAASWLAASVQANWERLKIIRDSEEGIFNMDLLSDWFPFSESIHILLLPSKVLFSLFQLSAQCMVRL